LIPGFQPFFHSAGEDWCQILVIKALREKLFFRQEIGEGYIPAIHHHPRQLYHVGLGLIDDLGGQALV